MSLYDEIHEQPEVFERLIESGTPAAQEIAAAVRKRPVEFVYLVARGSSDNAGLYAKYLLGIQNRLPVALAVPSLFTLYKAPPRIGRSLVIAISQSGESPDIVEAVTEARRQGATTLVLTNSPRSPLAQAAEFVLDILAGDEKAVAATKSYTAQLLAVALLSAALDEEETTKGLISTLPARARETLSLCGERELKEVTRVFRKMDRCVVLGRGINYATAFEWALKLKELAYVAAEPYSSADFQHGPIALIDSGFPVLAVVADGVAVRDVQQLATRLKEERGAQVLLVSNGRDSQDVGIPTLRYSRIDERLSPLLSILPAQLFSYHLTRERCLDPDNPRGLRKVTETK